MCRTTFSSCSSNSFATNGNGDRPWSALRHERERANDDDGMPTSHSPSRRIGWAGLSGGLAFFVRRYPSCKYREASLWLLPSAVGTCRPLKHPCRAPKTVVGAAVTVRRPPEERRSPPHLAERYLGLCTCDVACDVFPSLGVVVPSPGQPPGKKSHTPLLGWLWAYRR